MSASPFPLQCSTLLEIVQKLYSTFCERQFARKAELSLLTYTDAQSSQFCQVKNLNYGFLVSFLRVEQIQQACIQGNCIGFDSRQSPI